MKRDEAQSLKQLLDDPERLVKLVCVSQENCFTKPAKVNPGDVLELEHLVETGKSIDLFDHLDPALKFKGIETPLSYRDFTLWYEGFSLDDFKRNPAKTGFLPGGMQ